MKLRNLYKILVLAVLFSACTEEEMITPNASFRLSNQSGIAAEYTCYVGETFYVVKAGEAEFFTLYDGNNGKVWGQSGSTGVQFQLNDSLPVSYGTAGKYDLTVVASSSGKFGVDYAQDIKSVQINVIDRRADFSNFSLLINGSEYKGVIDGERNISISLPDIFADSITAAKPIFVPTSNTAKVYVNAIEQISGQSIQNLSQTVTYKVVAPNGDFTEYKVKAVLYASSNEKKITQFKLVNDRTFGNGEVGVIDEDAKSINIVLNYGTPANRVKADIISSVSSTYLYNGSIAFGTYINLSGTGTNPLSTIKVIAQNKTEQTYTVSATQDAPFKTFTFAGLNPAPITDINATAKTITVKVLKGTDITKLTAVWTGTLGDVKIGSVKQVNGSTVNDFSSPKQYKLYKGTTNSDNYTVSVITLE